MINPEVMAHAFWRTIPGSTQDGAEACYKSGERGLGSTVVPCTACPNQATRTQMVYSHQLQAAHCCETPSWTGRWFTPKGDRWSRVWACPEHLDGLTGLPGYSVHHTGQPVPWAVIHFHPRPSPSPGTVRGGSYAAASSAG